MVTGNISGGRMLIITLATALLNLIRTISRNSQVILNGHVDLDDYSQGNSYAWIKGFTPWTLPFLVEGRLVTLYSQIVGRGTMIQIFSFMKNGIVLVAGFQYEKTTTSERQRAISGNALDYAAIRTGPLFQLTFIIFSNIFGSMVRLLLQ